MIRKSVGLLLLALGPGVALAAEAVPIEPGRGELLYATKCRQCHSEQVHWRDKRRARDWKTLTIEVRRWQRFQKLHWNGDDIDLVARYLNAMYYHYPAPER